MGVMNEDRLTLYDGLIKTHITNTTVAKETGKGLSTNDYTTDEKTKLAGIADGANKTIVDSALNTSSTNPVQNKVIAGEITTLKKSVSDGKTLVATAITDKGVDTAADATFAVMAENIGQIETGGGELHGATISVTTNEENPTTITVTLTKDSTTIGQKNFDSNGLCTFTDIQESGDYTITASDGTDSNSTTATVTGDNIVNKTVVSVTIDFTLDGSTATPLNDVSIWLRTDSTGSSLNAGHTTLAQVIADTTTLSSLMADESAMNYLARSTGFAEEGCASETFMTYLGASPYVDSTVLNSDLWWSAIFDSSYMTKIIDNIVPSMTQDSQYGVTLSASVVLDTYPLRRLTDRVITSSSATDFTCSIYCGNFNDGVKENTNYFQIEFSSMQNVIGFKLYGTYVEGYVSSQETTWSTKDIPVDVYADDSKVGTVTLKKPQNYSVKTPSILKLSSKITAKKFRFYFQDSNIDGFYQGKTSYKNCYINEIEIYGR